MTENDMRRGKKRKFKNRIKVKKGKKGEKKIK